jgi:hypothetical protein
MKEIIIDIEGYLSVSKAEVRVHVAASLVCPPSIDVSYWLK